MVALLVCLAPPTGPASHPGEGFTATVRTGGVGDSRPEKRIVGPLPVKAPKAELDTAKDDVTEVEDVS